ncbi:MAG: hypothetical protein ACI8QQ_001472, partial [Psychroserpens sp.]
LIYNFLDVFLFSSLLFFKIPYYFGGANLSNFCKLPIKYFFFYYEENCNVLKQIYTNQLY